MYVVKCTVADIYVDQIGFLSWICAVEVQVHPRQVMLVYAIMSWFNQREYGLFIKYDLMQNSLSINQHSVL